MGKECKQGGEPSLLLAAAVAGELARGKNARELFEMGKFINLIKENLYVLADQRLNWPDPVPRAAPKTEKKAEEKTKEQKP